MSLKPLWMQLALLKVFRTNIDLSLFLVQLFTIAFVQTYYKCLDVRCGRGLIDVSLSNKERLLTQATCQRTKGALAHFIFDSRVLIWS
jgi:hypothetical protein